MCVSQVINEIADGYQYGVIRDFVGHGVGRVFHADPHILHTRNNDKRPMKTWQTFTIEPMFVEVRLMQHLMHAHTVFSGVHTGMYGVD